MSELYARGFTEGAEGPSCDFDGSVYAVDYLRTGTIGRVGPGGEAEVFFTLPRGSVGCGTCLGRDGGLYIADYTGHNILRLDLQDKSRTGRPAPAGCGAAHRAGPNWPRTTWALPTAWN